MDFIVCGLNHSTAPVEVRERCAFSEDQSFRALDGLRGDSADFEHLILSTCNRTELYWRRTTKGAEIDADPRGAFELYRRVHESVRGEQLDDSVYDHLYVHRRERAVEHLFRLAAGIDSMIVGETQILQQIKKAFSSANHAGTAGKLFRRLFPAALRAGKRVRAETGISTGCITPGQAAVELARQALGDLSSLTAVVLGSGKIAELATLALSGNIRHCLVVNRTLERAEELVRRSKIGVAVSWERLDECLEQADIVISSTGSAEPVVDLQLLGSIQRRRRDRPLVAVDLAVPRDFAPEVGVLPGVHIFNIDDLNRVVQQNVISRHRHLPEAEKLVDSAVRAFGQQMTYLEVEPVIRHLMDRFEQIRLGELQKSIGQLPVEYHERVEELTRSLVKKLLHFPIEKLKTLRDMQGLTPAEVEFVRRMFFNSGGQ